MRMYIIRHGKVDYRWSSRCDSEGFDKDCFEYDRAPLANGVYELPTAEKLPVYISTLQRSRDTADKLFGGGEYAATELINEVPLRSSLDTKLKLPQWFWELSGRLQWYTDNRRQPEVKSCTRERAARFIAMAEETGKDCYVITHGFFMHTLRSELKKRGYKTSGTRLKYKNGGCLEAQR